MLAAIISPGFSCNNTVAGGAVSFWIQGRYSAAAYEIQMMERPGKALSGVGLARRHKQIVLDTNCLPGITT